MESTEQAQIPEVAVQAEEHHEKKTPQESFAELRRQKEQLEREAWQAKKELELLREHQKQQQQPVQQEKEFDFRQLAQQEFPDGKVLVEAFGTIDKKLSNYEQKLAEKEAKIKALEFAQDHPDFKDVVTAENIEKYIKSDEDNLESVNNSANPLRKVYRIIKKELEKAPKEKPVSQEQRRVDEKESKPKTGSLGVRSEAVSTAASMSNSRMTKQQKAALWAETMAAARR